MDESSGIRRLDEDKYTFIVGRKRYTLTTSLDDENFGCVVANVRAAVDSFPPNLSQEDRLFLALMSMSHRMHEIGRRLDGLIENSMPCGEEK